MHHYVLKNQLVFFTSLYVVKLILAHFLSFLIFGLLLLNW